MPNPILFSYFCSYVIHASGFAVPSFEAFASYVYAWLSVPVIIRKAQIGTFCRDFHDPRLGVSGDSLTRPMIGPLSVRLDKIQLYIGWTRLIHDAKDVQRCLLLFYR